MGFFSPIFCSELFDLPDEVASVMKPGRRDMDIFAEVTGKPKGGVTKISNRSQVSKHNNIKNTTKSI